jgi:hypothetical protein
MPERWQLARDQYGRTAHDFIENGDRLVGRLSFWRQFGWLASPILKRLSDRLNTISDGLERLARALEGRPQ